MPKENGSSPQGDPAATTPKPVSDLIDQESWPSTPETPDAPPETPETPEAPEAETPETPETPETAEDKPAKKEEWFHDGDGSRYRTAEEAKAGIAEKDRVIKQLKDDKEAERQRYESLKSTFSPYYEFDAQGRVIGQKADPGAERKKLAEAALSGDVDSLEKLLDSASDTAVTRAQSAAQGAAWAAGERDALRKEYPDFENVSTPVHQEALSIMRERNIPDTIQNLRSVLELATLSMLRKNGGAIEQSIVDSAHRKIKKAEANGSPPPGGAPRRQEPSTVSQYLSAEQIAVARKMGRDPEKVAAVMEKLSKEGSLIK